ncbi:sodium channel protein Nach-like [Photinus pyralis]|uniref:sodium channel protein Nach-like n=1 Tax=Photinus pyralis TaxID=7054 RepID=UPI0012677BA1|nr:sodium channel protein Nach-like [Photinus pyralis]
MNKLIQKLVLPTTAKPIGMQQIRLLLQLFPNVRDVELDIEDLQSLQTVLDYNNMTVQDALYNISPSCKDTVIQCKWKGDIRRCGSLFEEVITPMGICCSFNYVHKNISQKEKRLAGMGKYSGLIVTLYNDVNDYVFTDILAYGQKTERCVNGVLEPNAP